LWGAAVAIRDRRERRGRDVVKRGDLEEVGPAGDERQIDRLRDRAEPDDAEPEAGQRSGIRRDIP